MAKYRRPPQELSDQPTFFLKHWWNQLVEWLTEHKDQVMTGVLVLAVLLLAAVIWQRFSESKNREAWAALGSAGGMAELESAVAKYGSTAAGAPLKLRLADQYLAGDQFDKAVSLYDSVALLGDPLLSPRASYTLAFALEASGEFDDATKTRETLISRGGFWGDRAKEATDSQQERKEAYDSLQASRKLAQEKKEAPKSEPPVSTPEETPPGEARQAEELESTDSAVVLQQAGGEPAPEAEAPPTQTQDSGTESVTVPIDTQQQENQ